MSWKPELQIDGVWVTNGLRFATQAEAELSAQNCFKRWSALSDCRCSVSDDEVNARYDGTRVVAMRDGYSD